MGEQLLGCAFAWTYRRLANRSSAGSWIRYNLTYVGLFAALPALSVALFDPVMTFAEASAAEGPLDALIVEALPMTIMATLVIAGLVSLLFGSFRHDFGAVLIANPVLAMSSTLGCDIVVG